MVEKILFEVHQRGFTFWAISLFDSSYYHYYFLTYLGQFKPKSLESREQELSFDTNLDGVGLHASLLELWAQGS